MSKQTLHQQLVKALKAENGGCGLDDHISEILMNASYDDGDDVSNVVRAFVREALQAVK